MSPSIGEGVGGTGDLQELSGTQEQDLTKNWQGEVDHSDTIGSQAWDRSVEGGCTGEFPQSLGLLGAEADLQDTTRNDQLH